MIEKKLIEGKVNLIDLMKANLKMAGFLQIFDNNKNFPIDYFQPENEGITHFSCFKDTIDMTRTPRSFECGIITKDGVVYKATSYNHVLTSMWLKFNGVDIKSSIRYYLSSNGKLQFYNAFGSYDSYESEPDKINDLIEMYNTVHKDGRTQLFKVYKPQINTIFNVTNGFNINIDDALTLNDSFGLLKNNEEYVTTAERTYAKYNKFAFEETLPIDIKELQRRYRAYFINSNTSKK